MGFSLPLLLVWAAPDWRRFARAAAAFGIVVASGLAVIGAMMAGDLGGVIQEADLCIGGHQGKRPVHGPGRDGIVVEVEMHVDGLARAYRFHPIGVEGMEWKRQQARLFLGVFRFSWKWRRRSPSKVKERAHEEPTETLRTGRESRDGSKRGCSSV
jgi:hypothetical protein